MCTLVHAQNKRADSLRTVISKSKPDSTKATALNDLAKELTNLGNYVEAKKTADAALTLSDSLEWQKGIADAYTNYGIICYYEGNYSEALAKNFDALTIREKIQDKKGIAGSYNNIAIIYNVQGDYSEALRYALTCLQLKEELGEKKGLVSTYNNIGLIYSNMRDYDKSLEYHNRALKLSTETQNAKAIANAYLAMGDIQLIKHSYDTAYDYLKRSLDIRDSIGYKPGIISSLISIGHCRILQDRLPEADSAFTRALALAKEIGDPDGVMRSYLGFSDLAAARSNYKEAYDYYRLFSRLQSQQDSVEMKNKSTGAEVSYRYEKQAQKEKADREQRESQLKNEAEKQQLITYFAGGIVLLLVVFSLFIVRSLAQNRRANKELDIKNRKLGTAYSIIETKNSEITDSINYAKRIQYAILPDKAELDKHLGEYFIQYRPKDIVGGDFYAFAKKGNALFVAAADCTGHGVPGAFMSLVGSKELSIALSKSDSPGEVLRELNIGLKTTLRQNSADATRDGMDIALISIAGRKVEFAGANRPLWIFHKATGELEEIKATKMAIGGITPDEQEYKQHEFSLQPGDVLYIFTDGYADQFGGPEKRKYMTSHLKTEVRNHATLSMQEQKEFLESEFLKWTDGVEQVDDILVIGIRIT